MTNTELKNQMDKQLKKYDLKNLSVSDGEKMSEEFKALGWNCLPYFHTNKNSIPEKGYVIFQNDDSGEEVAFNPIVTI